jgi:hypothetical protein
MKKLFALLAAALTFTSTAFAEIGSLSSDLVFTPVTPCRIMDTRNPGPKSGILAAGSTRGFFGWGTNFSAQGGVATNCGSLLSSNNAAILVNFTVVTPDTGGFITAFPADVSDANKPLAATVNFNAGSVVGNNATIKLNQNGLDDDFKIFTTSNVHVVADIVGYYSRPVATELECVETANTDFLISASGGTGNAVAPVCPTGYKQTATNCESTSFNMPIVYFQSGICSAKNNDSTSQTLRASRTCCRIPGR